MPMQNPKLKKNIPMKYIEEPIDCQKKNVACCDILSLRIVSKDEELGKNSKSSKPRTKAKS